MSRAAQPPSLSEALDGLWVRFRPEIEQRIATLEASAAVLAAHTLTRDQQKAAHAAAHKLAGVLGTFGLAEGTELAREIERLFDPEAGADAEGVKQCASLAARLRTIVENRK